MIGWSAGTLFIPLIGIVVGAMNLKTPGKQGQAKGLLIFGIAMVVVNTLVMMGSGY
jgi:hypothetical protein